MCCGSVYSIHIDRGVSPWFRRQLKEMILLSLIPDLCFDHGLDLVGRDHINT